VLLVAVSIASSFALPSTALYSGETILAIIFQARGSGWVGQVKGGAACRICDADDAFLLIGPFLPVNLGSQPVRCVSKVQR